MLKNLEKQLSQNQKAAKKVMNLICKDSKARRAVYKEGAQGHRHGEKCV